MKTLLTAVTLASVASLTAWSKPPPRDMLKNMEDNILPEHLIKNHLSSAMKFITFDLEVDNYFYNNWLHV